jgi:A/G-specific adenine glycosylase
LTTDVDRVGALLDWYAEEARDLPWRRDPSPYHVLLSELMLQQTRVDTVVPYFRKFVERWPRLEDLAAADPEDVLVAWAGLGYYSRARNLQRCAIAAVAAGGLPSDPAALRELPGIGPYTAGAVASIAFGVRTPLVDGNVERVLCRLDARDEDPRREGRTAIWQRATALLDALPEDAHPGALNQALMELGATICTPRAPRCTACPIATGCRARESGDPERWPKKVAKPKARPVQGVAAIVRRPEGLLLGRRPEGLLGGMWEPVGCEYEGDDPLAALSDALRDRLGVRLESARYLGTVVHVFTHRRLTCAVYDAAVTGDPRAVAHYPEVRWTGDPAVLPLSTLAKKMLALEPSDDAPGLPFGLDSRGSGLPLAAEPD